MVTVMVDFENVGAQGLKGIEFLNSKDHLILFYSSTCCSISRKQANQIEQSKCRLDVRELVSLGKNALDYYIAAECGRALEKGVTQIAIISKDKGYGAVADYINSYAIEYEAKVIIAPSVDVGLSQMSDHDGKRRRTQIIYEREMLSIDAVATEITDLRKSKLPDGTVKRLPYQIPAGGMHSYIHTVRRIGAVIGEKLSRLLKSAA